MDYEKAYKEALKRAKSMMALPDDKATMEYIFPELAESEDERIRKEILEYFNQYKDEGLRGVDITPWIAYLEKQKANTEGDFARGYDCGYEACLNSHGAEWFEKQKEIPAEWSEEDKRKLNMLYSIVSQAADAHAFFTTTRLISDRDAIELHNFLKSLRPQPHWKPTEEQMDELEKVSSGNTCAFNYEILRELYDNLKKL